MSNKAGSMFIFILGLVIAGPIGLAAAVLSLAWGWQYVAGCFFSLSYSCGQVDLFKGMIFGALAFGYFTLLKTLWSRAK